MNRKMIYLLSISLALLMLVGCQFPLAQQTDQLGVETIVAYTLTANAAATQSALPPVVTVPPVVISIATSTITSTPMPTLTTFPTYTLYPTNTQVPCNQAEFVIDVTIPDNTHINPGSAFTKTWRLKNTGSCAWTTSYKLVFDSGDAMSGPASVNLPSAVAPNSTIDISVNLTSPAPPASYTGNWKLMDQNSVRFGLGAANKPFWVKIIVDSPFFAVTAANATTPIPNYTGPCPFTFVFTANVTTTSAGNVTYFWIFGDGTTTAPQTLTFTAAGTKPITTSLTLAATSAGWAAVSIDEPNHQQFPAQVFSITCVP